MAWLGRPNETALPYHEVAAHMWQGPFLSAVEHQPEARSNWLNLARLHQAKGRTDAANEAMARARGLSGN